MLASRKAREAVDDLQRAGRGRHLRPHRGEPPPREGPALQSALRSLMPRLSALQSPPPQGDAESAQKMSFENMHITSRSIQHCLPAHLLVRAVEPLLVSHMPLSCSAPETKCLEAMHLPGLYSDKHTHQCMSGQLLQAVWTHITGGQESSGYRCVGCVVQEAAIYLRHELEAHALAYKAIKALPGAPLV